MAPALLLVSRLFAVQEMARPPSSSSSTSIGFPPEDGDSLLPLEIFRVKAGVDGRRRCRRRRRRNGIEKEDESENNHRRRHLERVVIIVRPGKRHYFQSDVLSFSHL